MERIRVARVFVLSVGGSSEIRDRRLVSFGVGDFKRENFSWVETFGFLLFLVLVLAFFLEHFGIRDT